MTAFIQREDGRLSVSGNMTIETAKDLLQAGVAAMGNGAATFDLAAVNDVDSAGLAVLFGWQRVANAQGESLRIANPPRSLSSLAEVYGVTGLLPLV